MEKPEKTNGLKFDFEAIKKQYDEHASRCRQIAMEVTKWGQKRPKKLTFSTNKN